MVAERAAREVPRALRREPGWRRRVGSQGGFRWVPDTVLVEAV